MAVLSDCCLAPVVFESADEGTNFYRCTSCGKPCDTVPQETPTYEDAIKGMSQIVQDGFNQAMKATVTGWLKAVEATPEEFAQDVKKYMKKRGFMNTIDASTIKLLAQYARERIE